MKLNSKKHYQKLKKSLIEIVTKIKLLEKSCKHENGFTQINYWSDGSKTESFYCSDCIEFPISHLTIPPLGFIRKDFDMNIISTEKIKYEL